MNELDQLGEKISEIARKVDLTARAGGSVALGLIETNKAIERIEGKLDELMRRLSERN